LVDAYKLQTSNAFHHCNAIPRPAAPYFANIAPYRLATGTISLLTTGTVSRMAAPVTQTTPIAVPLAGIPRHSFMLKYQLNDNIESTSAVWSTYCYYF
jgi:hypothetical protein